MKIQLRTIGHYSALFLFLLSGLVSVAQGPSIDLSQRIPLDPKVKSGKLDNGLTYFIRQNSKPEQKVELRLVLNAGSLCEDDDQQGLAHMCEHMAFNGTTHFKKNDIVSFLQDIGVQFGGDLNAYTSFNETVYILPIPTDKPGNLEKGFRILEDWAHNVTYLDQDIDDERAIILEESRLGKGAEDRMGRQIYPQLLAGSKYAERLPIGKDSIIKNFKYEQIRRFYRDWYRPDLMAVIVVGDIAPEKAEAMVREHFSGLRHPENERPRPVFPIPPYADSEAKVVTDKEATGYSVDVNYSFFPKPAEKTLGDYRSDLVQRLYTSMLNQRLQELTQKSDPPFVGAGVGFGSFARGYDAFSASAYAGTGDPGQALKAMMLEVERVKKYGFTEAELERARKSRLAFYERAYNDRDKTESSNYVDEYVNLFLDQEPSPGIENEYQYVKEMLPGIKLAEVNAISNVIKEHDNKFVSLMGPESTAGEALPTANELLATISASEKADVKPYEEKAVAASLLEAEPKAGKLTAKSENAPLGTTDITLSNGVTVTLKPTTFKNDQVLMAATRPGGKSNYAATDKYSAEYCTQVITAMGVGEFSPTDLRKALAGKTVSVAPVFGNTSEGFSGSSSAKDLESMLQLIHLYMTSPRKDTALFRSFITRNKAQYAMLGANPQVSFVDTMYQVLYQHNPLAPIAVPKTEYFDQVDLDRCLAIYRQRFCNANDMHFTFVGSFSNDELIPLLEKYLGSLPSQDGKFTYTDTKVRPLPGKKEFTYNKGKEQKSLILTFVTGEIPFSSELEMKADVLSEILNIRVIEELREKIQGIYGGGTFAQIEKFPYPHYNFIVQLPCGPEKVDTLLKAVNKEFSDIVAHGPQESYLDKVKKQLTEQFKVAVKENNTWLQALQDMYQKKEDPKYFLDYEKMINNLTVKDIQGVARQLLNGKNRFTAVLMPAENAESESAPKKKGF